MKTKKQVYDLAEKLNISIDDNSDEFSWSITLWMPKGFVSGVNGSHCVVVMWFVGKGDKPNFWQHVFDDLSCGIDECEDLECEFCKQKG